MPTHRSMAGRRLVTSAGLFVAALLLVACGGGSDDGTAQAAAAGPGKAVHTGKTDAGTVLVDAKGMTLYAFAADSPRKSTCTGSCLQYWPAAEVSSPVDHSSDVTAKLATIKGTDGATQLTVNGWPAYTYAADSEPGDASGQGKDLSGGLWWVFAPNGDQIKAAAGGGVGGY